MERKNYNRFVQQQTYVRCHFNAKEKILNNYNLDKFYEKLFKDNYHYLNILLNLELKELLV